MDINYFDTYTSVTKSASICALIAITSIHNLVMYQMDVKIAFLHGDLMEEICMKQPDNAMVLE